MLGIALISRLAFWGAFLYIIGHGVMASFTTGEVGMAVAKVVFFPLTFTIYPWTAGLQGLFIGALIAYWISTFGGLEPVG